jgi:hypothetical protein
VVKESCTDAEPKVYGQTPIEAMTPMMTVARTGVLNRRSVFPNWRGSTPSEPIAKVTRTPDTRLARVDPRAERATARIMYLASAEPEITWAM